MSTQARNNTYYDSLLEAVRVRFPFEDFVKKPNATIDQIPYILQQEEEQTNHISKKWKHYLEGLQYGLLVFLHNNKKNMPRKAKAYDQVLMLPFEQDQNGCLNEQSLNEFNDVFNIKYSKQNIPSHIWTIEDQTHSRFTIDHNNNIDDAVILEEKTNTPTKPINIDYSEHHKDVYYMDDTHVKISVPMSSERPNTWPPTPKPNIGDHAEDANVIEEAKQQENTVEEDGQELPLDKQTNEEKPNTRRPAGNNLIIEKIKPQEPIPQKGAQKTSISEQVSEEDTDTKTNFQEEKSVEKPTVSEHNSLINDLTDTTAFGTYTKDPKPPKKKKNFVSRFFKSLWKNRANIAGSFIIGGAVRYIAGPAYAAVVPAVSFGRASLKAAKQDYHKTLDELLNKTEEELRTQNGAIDPERKLSFKELLAQNLNALQEKMIEDSKACAQMNEGNEQFQEKLINAQDLFDKAKQAHANDNKNEEKKQALNLASEKLEQARINFETVANKTEDLRGVIEAAQDKFKALQDVQRTLEQKENKRKFLSRDFWRHARDNRKNIWKDHKKEILTKTAFSAVAAVVGSAVAEMIPEDILGLDNAADKIEQVKDYVQDKEKLLEIEIPKEVDTEVNSETTSTIQSEVASPETDAPTQEDFEIKTDEISAPIDLSIDDRIANFIEHAQDVRGDQLEEWALKSLQDYSEASPKANTAWQILEMVHGSTDPELIKEASDIIQDLGLDQNDAALNAANNNEAYAHALKGEWKEALKDWADPASKGHQPSMRHLNEIQDFNLGGFGERAADFLQSH